MLIQCMDILQLTLRTRKHAQLHSKYTGWVKLVSLFSNGRRYNIQIHVFKIIYICVWHIAYSGIWMLVFIYMAEYPFVTINSLWPRDATQRHRTGSYLVKVLTCCLTTQVISRASVALLSVEYSPGGNFTANAKNIIRIFWKITCSKLPP